MLQVTLESVSVLQVMRESVPVLQVTLESVPVVQVMREFVSSTTSHVHASERAMKLKVKSLSL